MYCWTEPSIFGVKCMNQELWISPLTDKQIVGIFGQLNKQFPDTSVSVNDGLKSYRMSGDGVDENAVSDFKKSTGFSIASANLSLNGFSISYNRHHNQVTPNANLTFSYNNNNPADFDNIRALKIEATKRFGQPPSIQTEVPADYDTISRFMQIETALGGAVDAFSKLQSEFHRKNEELREDHQANVNSLKEQLAEERSNWQHEIGEQRRELEAARRALDDRSNTHARREIRKDIKSDIDSSFEKKLFSDATVEQRKPVRAAFWLGTVFLGVISFISLLPTLGIPNGPSSIPTGSDLWLAYAKSTLTGFGAVGFLAFYIKWETSWTAIQGEYERNLATARIDIDRASWVTESVLEWQREAGEREMPNQLLESFTRRLFDWDGRLEASHSNADDLASAIIGSAARVNIGADGASVELDRKGVKKLQKEN